MPRRRCHHLRDLIGKLDVLRVVCSKCQRGGAYRLERLILSRGRDAKIIDWLDEISKHCPKKIRPQYERSMRCAVP